VETIAERKPTVRFAKNFIVEENLDAVQWPQECAACGNPGSVTDSISLEEDFKGFGKIHVEVPGIPYCQDCFPRIRTGKRLKGLMTTLTWILGIPIGILFIVLSYTSNEVQPMQTRFIFCGLLLLLGLAAGYGLAWLFVKLPAKIFLKKKFIEPVDAWLIKEQKKDKKEGISVVIAIPNKIYRRKFAALNGVLLPGG
jgi:hypothetical protein